MRSGNAIVSCSRAFFQFVTTCPSTSRPEALRSADEGLELLSQVGLTEEGTTLLGLVRAEALQALGYRTQAVEALTDACRRLRERAEKISDVALRATFLSRIGENRRTLALAEAWQGGPEA